MGLFALTFLILAHQGSFLALGPSTRTKSDVTFGAFDLELLRAHLHTIILINILLLWLSMIYKHLF